MVSKYDYDMIVSVLYLTGTENGISDFTPDDTRLLTY
ncbi:MAG: hypothetical protein J07HQW2_02381 [Haloquadratum walsbyi J07HQW2]|uniref:Uncharacterized protein n=1 Tax=Haloquadratum walsbyi J07HQW2 TaxID=1238425 RepID=U1PU83_9EURY|nr:MAG: hypothetical protein J07HQW2_02381 [Haloquadratum walsbyi J07HQW2]